MYAIVCARTIDELMSRKIEQVSDYYITSKDYTSIYNFKIIKSGSFMPNGYSLTIAHEDKTKLEELVVLVSTFKEAFSTGEMIGKDLQIIQELIALLTKGLQK